MINLYIGNSKRIEKSQTICNEFDNLKVFQFFTNNNIKKDHLNKSKLCLVETLKVLYSNEDKIHLFFPEAYQSSDTVLLLSEVIIEQSRSKDITIDTSSEILLYAIRLSIKKNFLKPEDVLITFFDNNDNEILINIDKDGRIQKWPKGFFDIFDILLSELL